MSDKKQQMGLEEQREAKRRDFIAKVRKHVCPDLNDSQFEIYIRRLYNLKKVGLDIDPFDLLLIPVVYKKGTPQEKVSYIATKDFYLRMLRKVPGYKGHCSHVICENDQYNMSSAMTLPEHVWKFNDRGAILGAWAAIWVEGIDRPFFKEVSFDEYKKQGDDSSFLWNRYPRVMIEKCALVACAREVGSALFHNTYVEGEIDTTSTIIETKALPSRDIFEPTAETEKTEPKALSTNELIKLNADYCREFGGRLPEAIREALGVDKEVRNFIPADVAKMAAYMATKKKVVA